MTRRTKNLPVRSPRATASDVNKTVPASDALPAASHDKVFNGTPEEASENSSLDCNGAQGGGPLELNSDRIFEPMGESKGEPIPAAVFDEAGYLRLNPDVRHAIELGGGGRDPLAVFNHGLDA